ncbi:CHAT domain-containing protein [Singulisphaera sp. Ch08]|uniref:CHAT domain-containing protein n=1 Tax=Singulisphaera sp. Ch08 TaxID=3120278 RepID=A0AAU7C9R2_9BACT
MNRPSLSAGHGIALWLASWLILWASPAHGMDETASRGFLIAVDGQGRLSVKEVNGAAVELETASRGLIVWENGGQERWAFLAQGGRWAREEFERSEEGAARLSAATRGPAEAIAGGNGSIPSTTLLVPMLGSSVVRGNSPFLTPSHGRTIGPRITIRRRPAPQGPPFPEAAALLLRDGRLLVKFALPEGKRKLSWNEISGLPPALAAGLSAGEYVLRIDGGGDSVTFRVEDAAIREEVQRPLDELTKLRGEGADGLFALVAVTHLLTQVDEEGKPLPYLVDAFDVVDHLPEGERTSFLRQAHSDLERRLVGATVADSSSLADPTGDATIDQARGQFRAGRWREAMATLATVDQGKVTPRSQALAKLYNAVIRAESGLALEAQADHLFHEALVAVEALGRDGKASESTAADLFRAHNNYGNFLLGRSQDRLQNHAYQIVTGGRLPLLSTLSDWHAALREYEAARTLAQGMRAPAQAAAVETNLARLYAILADLIRTLEDPASEDRRFLAAVLAATEQARTLAAGIVADSRDGDRVEPLIQATAHEILAQLAFRDHEASLGRPEAQASTLNCERLAKQALHAYEEAGSLVGIESTLRLLALNQLRSKPQGSGTEEKADRKQALQSLLIAHRLSQFVLDQVPGDGVGLGVAGFIARRAYVNEQIVELLIADGQPAEALHYAELAKARALEGLLATNRTDAQADEAGPRPLPELLADWPREVAAVEYFIGSGRVWAFVVTTMGQVRVFGLSDREGHPIAPQALVARVRTFLRGVENYATRMRSRLLAGQGFDHQWQETLHEFALDLLPADLLVELRKAKTVVVVPHHILHYFPFAALVTERDAGRKTESEMVQPRFLLDEPFALCHSPSLTTWDLLRQRDPRLVARVGAAGIANFPGAAPLPGVRDDLANLRKAFGGKVDRVYLEGEASEAAGRSLLSQAGMVLFATHGTNVADRPLTSSILLFPEAKDDGRLTAEELFGGSTQADLVVLSACYTGLADRSPLPGDDLFGIQRALLRSGARTVISGLWDVYDGSGPELIGAFFDNLAAGEPAPQALATSQRRFLKKLRTSPDPEPWIHPYFWAVYTASGDDRTRFGN